MPPKPEFFPSAPAFQAWLLENHALEETLWVGFHKRGSGVPSMTWEESVDLALCFGWIDGLRKRLDANRYVIRFSRRKPRSIWSVRNVARVRELEGLGLMKPAGLEAFSKMRSERQAVYSYEQGDSVRLGADHERRFRASREAWAYFRAQAPSYRRIVAWWVSSAKKEATRRSRLGRLIDASGRRCHVDAVPPPGK